MSERLSYQLGFFFSFAFAFFIFIYLYGFSFLLPSQTSWMLNGDPSQHFYGFNFFLSESWHWPLGLITDFNWPFQTSLVYTDSIPLIAIPLKLIFSNSVVQFHGIWILFCFLMQGAVGYWFLFRASQNATLSCVGSIFITLFPSFLLRGFDPSRHYSCLAHFLIFPAIALAVSAFENKTDTRSRTKFWFVLLMLSLGIHFYFFYLNLLIFLTVEFKSFFGRRGFLSLMFIGGASILLMAAFGYFVIPVTRSFDGGFASYSMNLLSWFDPEGYSIGHWKLPTVNGDQREGYQYLGLGTLTLIGFMLGQKNNREALKNSWLKLRSAPSLMLTVFFFLFALSIRLSLGSYILSDVATGLLYFAVFFILLRKYFVSFPKATVFSVAILVCFIFSGHLLRSSGRAGWYISYFLIFALFRLKPKPWMIAIAVLVQGIDVAPILASIRLENQALLVDSQTKITSQSFEVAGLANFIGSRPAITLLTLTASEQAPVAEYALVHHLKLGPVYVARGQIKFNHEWTILEREKVSSGKLEPEDLIVTRALNVDGELSLSAEVETLKIGNYLWIKEATKN